MAESVSITSGGHRLLLRWRQGGESAYPAIWLRDNCRCPSCFIFGNIHVRALLTENLDVTCTITDVKLSNNNTEVTMTWSDGHSSGIFPCSWLKQRAFEPTPQKIRAAICQPEIELWDSSLADDLPRGDFSSVMSDDAAMLDALLKLERYGLVILENTPKKLGQCTEFCNRVAFLRPTHFGQEEFTVRVKVDPNSIAYTGKNIEVHTDACYYDYMPSIQMLQFITQYDGRGGETQLADAGRVVRDLQREDPDAFHILTTVKVNFKNVTMGENGKHNFKLLMAPVITMDDNGDLKFLRFTTSQRDSYFSVQLEQVEPWYRAMKKLLHMLYHSKYMIRRKMNEGDMVVFDNVRVVHGREPLLEANKVGERLLAGTYLDWDEVRSRRRVLQERLAGNPSGYSF